MKFPRNKCGELSGLLKKYCNVNISKRSMSLFTRQSKRLGKENEEDFYSSVVIECLEVQKEVSILTDVEVYRAIDRVAHRFTREIKRLSSRRVSDVNIDGLYFRKTKTHEYDKLATYITDAISKLSPLHLILFEKIVMNGERIPELAQEMRMSERTLYRRLQEIREAVKEMYSS